jgi:hypothetical protein
MRLELIMLPLHHFRMKLMEPCRRIERRLLPYKGSVIPLYEQGMVGNLGIKPSLSGCKPLVRVSTLVALDIH